MKSLDRAKLPSLRDKELAKVESEAENLEKKVEVKKRKVLKARKSK